MLVSVIIPCYNRETMIVDALQSVYDQSYRPIEMIVVDDGSTDNSIATIESFISSIKCGEEFVVKLLSKNNGGAPSARNLGLKKANGELIQFLDSDDILHVNKINIQVKYLLDHPNVEFVYSQAGIFHNSIGDSDKVTGNHRSMSLEGHIGAHALKTDLGIYRSALIKKMGLWNEDLQVWQEREYNLRLFVYNANIAYLPGVLSYYRVHKQDRISKSLTEQRHLDSLEYLSKTAVRLNSYQYKIANSKIASHFFSIYLHSIFEEKYSIAKKASFRSFYPALISKDLYKFSKSVFLILLTVITPYRVQSYFVKQFKTSL